MGFQEFTATDGSSEVMIDVCVKTGKVIDVYTYNDCEIHTYNERLEDFVDITEKWAPSQNPLFVKCPANKRKYTLTKMFEDNFVICNKNDDREQSEEEFEILHKMFTYYKLQKLQTLLSRL